jgi:predicted homoserine dehydrogenase-like protein
MTSRMATGIYPACFKQYGLLTDPSGWFGSMWRPFHIIGLETSISVLSAVLRGEDTGTAKEFRGDALPQRSAT